MPIYVGHKWNFGKDIPPSFPAWIAHVRHDLQDEVTSSSLIFSLESGRAWRHFSFDQIIPVKPKKQKKKTKKKTEQYNFAAKTKKKPPRSPRSVFTSPDTATEPVHS